MKDLPIICGMVLLFTLIMFGLPAVLLLRMRKRNKRAHGQRDSVDRGIEKGKGEPQLPLAKVDPYDSKMDLVPVSPWIFRALINAIQLCLLGVLAGVLFPLALAWIGMVALPGQPSASPRDAGAFLNNLYSNHPERAVTIALVAGLISFGAGAASTPTLGVHRKKSDKNRIILMGCVINFLMLGVFGPLGGLNLGDALTLGLTIGLPLTWLLSSMFYNKAEKGFYESGKCQSIFYWVTHRKDAGVIPPETAQEPKRKVVTVLPIPRDDVEHISDITRGTLESIIGGFAAECVEEKQLRKITLTISGYDDDPRELYEIPEVCAWAKDAFKSLPSLWFFLDDDFRDRFTGWLCGPVDRKDIESSDFLQRLNNTRMECSSTSIAASASFLEQAGASKAMVSAFYFQEMGKRADTTNVK